jgi:ribosomal protein S18 acetylase RimI-like enzyme
MTKVKKAIELIDYHEGWAKEVAKMWNLSRDGWGGDTRVMTEQQVREKEAHSDNINLFLAVDGNEVVGYCGLSEYKEDTGSLYIPLLNVRPDYQGHKIGKMLLLHALDKTIQLGWERLDLYTWAGNTKAVPLYKKCGFFWEDREDTTHLMNFIPLVLNTPLLQPVFNKLDWYDSNERVIEVKPDGVKENGFTFYEYNWVSDSVAARVQVERSARGLRLIETDDFLLEFSLGDHEIIEEVQGNYQIRLVNKTGNPLTFKALGKGQGRVQYSIDTNAIVSDELTITEPFTILTGEEPSIWRTHPNISVEVWINELKCELRLGVFPLQPAKIEARISGNLSYLNKETFIDLVVKNNLKEDAEFLIKFPNHEKVTLDIQQFMVAIPASSRKYLKVPIQIRSHGFYQAALQITAKKKDSVEIRFDHDIHIAFKGLGTKFGGESKDYWHIYNGLSQVNIRKRDLLLTFAKNNLKKQPMGFFPPKLGKPYVNEFSKKKPNSVNWEIDDSSILFKIELESGEMPGIHLTQIVQLYGDGLFHKWMEIENRGSLAYKEIFVCVPHFHELGSTYFPLENNIVHFDEKRMIEFGDLVPSSLTSNWYFSKHTPEPIGVSWSANSKATPEGWQFIVEEEIQMLTPGSKQETGKMVVSVGAFNEWEDFSAYVHERTLPEKSTVIGEYHLQADKIIAQLGTDLLFKNFRNSYLDGQLQISVNDQVIYKEDIHADDEKTAVIFQSTRRNDPVTLVTSQFKGNSLTSHCHELLLSPTDDSISIQKTTLDGLEVFEVSNGIMTIKAAAEFYPGLFSLKVRENEWLDHSFPSLTAKSWWNPWAGGLKTYLSGMNTFSLKKENHFVTSVEQDDLEGNKWSGIAMTTEILEHTNWKGCKYVQYFLMLPGVPLLATYLDVLNASGKNIKEEDWVSDFFVGGEPLTQLSFHTKGEPRTLSYKAGVQELSFQDDLDCYISSLTKPEKLYFIPSLYSSSSEAYTNKDAFQVQSIHSAIPNKESTKTAPLFILFDDRILSEALLKRIRRIQF